MTKHTKRRGNSALTLLWIAIIAVAVYAMYRLTGGESLLSAPKAKVDSKSAVATDQTHQVAAATLKELCLRERVELPSVGSAGQLIEHEGHTLLYDNELRLSRWVAYRLDADELDAVCERSNFFQPDPEVDGVRVTTRDYTSSGYDRGHLAPAADMRWDQSAMEQCFYMTNICPQNRQLNGGDWKDLEERVRNLAKIYGNVWVVCGPIVSQRPKRIGDNRVAVPSAFFKAVLVVTDTSATTSGWIFANNSTRQPVDRAAVTVDSIEVVCGCDLFPLLPDSVENRIESRLGDLCRSR